MFHTPKKLVFQMLCTNVFTSLFVSISHLPPQVWHIKQHEHYTGAPCAGDKKRPLKCVVLSHNATDISIFEGECNWHADCRNIQQSCCQRTECLFLYHHRFREFGSTSNRPHSRRPCVPKPSQDIHIPLIHLQDHLRRGAEEYFCL